MQNILSFFPKLSATQKDQFEQLLPLYKEWNDKINVISRKDIDNLYEHHVLHSLAITRLIEFKPGSMILDLGTGGGFPGIPLAIFYPKVQFTLIDGTRKKIHVVEEVAKALNLNNVIALQKRAEEFKGKRFDFVVTRAVANLEKLLNWTQKLIKIKEQHGLPNGLIALKGGKLSEEIKALSLGEVSELYPISDFFDLDYFKEKYIVYVQR